MVAVGVVVVVADLEEAVGDLEADLEEVEVGMSVSWVSFKK